MDYNLEVLEVLKEIKKELKQHTLILNNIEKLFSKYDTQYLEEMEKEGNFPQG